MLWFSRARKRAVRLTNARKEGAVSGGFWGQTDRPVIVGTPAAVFWALFGQKAPETKSGREGRVRPAALAGRQRRLLGPRSRCGPTVQRAVGPRPTLWAHGPALFPSPARRAAKRPARAARPRAARPRRGLTGTSPSAQKHDYSRLTKKPPAVGPRSGSVGPRPGALWAHGPARCGPTAHAVGPRPTLRGHAPTVRRFPQPPAFLALVKRTPLFLGPFALVFPG